MSDILAVDCSAQNTIYTRRHQKAGSGEGPERSVVGMGSLSSMDVGATATGAGNEKADRMLGRMAKALCVRMRPFEVVESSRDGRLGRKGCRSLCDERMRWVTATSH